MDTPLLKGFEKDNMLMLLEKGEKALDSPSRLRGNDDWWCEELAAQDFASPDVIPAKAGIQCLLALASTLKKGGEGGEEGEARLGAAFLLP